MKGGVAACGDVVFRISVKKTIREREVEDILIPRPHIRSLNDQSGSEYEGETKQHG